MERPSDAEAPQHFSVRDWGQILRRAARRVLETRLPLISAGIAFFALLSIAPLLVTALSVYGAVNSPQHASEQLTSLARTLPIELQPVIAGQLRAVAAASTSLDTVRGLVSLALALWTATAATTALLDALAMAYHETETRPVARRVGTAAMLVLVGGVVLGALLAAARTVAVATAHAPSGVRASVPWLAGAVLAVMMAVALAVLYRLTPSRRGARWRWTSVGAVGATVVWLLASVALFTYVRQLGTYASTYGSLAGVAISMFWLWLTVLLVVVGAVVNAEAERQTTHDSTVGPHRPVGDREAVVADSVPPYPEP